MMLTDYECEANSTRMWSLKYMKEGRGWYIVMFFLLF